MENLYDRIENHYQREALYEDIIQRLQELKVDLDKVKRSDIAAVDEFHVRGAIVSKELAGSIDLNGLKVLDVGCGLGGPCRMLAEKYNCQTTGIDLSQEFIRTARKLSELVHLDDKTSFIQGNATNLPFEDATFDAVWTQHVQMNIPGKEEFYSEIHRVLKGGGYFLFYEILKKGSNTVSYPMPWATTEEHSFLFGAEKMVDIMENLGFKKVYLKDQSREGIDFFSALLQRIQEEGPPKIGLNVLMGESTELKLKNLHHHLRNGHLELISGVYQK